MTAFQPVREKARWRYLYDLLTEQVDGIITYVQMGQALELDPDADRHTIQAAIRRAAREYEEVNKRALEPIPNIGYRVVDAPEHIRLARRQQSRAQFALRSGRSKVVNVDLNNLDADTQKVYEVVATGFAYMLDINRRMDVRQRRLAEQVAAITVGQSRSDSELTELRARLERLEAAVALP